MVPAPAKEVQERTEPLDLAHGNRWLWQRPGYRVVQGTLNRERGGSSGIRRNGRGEMEQILERKAESREFRVLKHCFSLYFNWNGAMHVP